MKRLLTLIACILCFHAAAAADLVAVYQRALQNDPQLREAEANRLAALESKPQALAALLPQVNGNVAIASKERDTRIIKSGRVRLRTFPPARRPSWSKAFRTSTATRSHHNHKYGVDLKQNIFRMGKLGRVCSARMLRSRRPRRTIRPHSKT